MEADGNNLSQVLPTRVGLVNNETRLPMEPIIPTEVRVEDVEHQQELRHEEEAESSHAGDRAGLTIGATNGKADQGEVAEPSMNDVLEAAKLMGTQMLALTQGFTPLVNSSVGQVTQVQTAAQAANGRAAPVAEVVEIDPPARPARRVDYLSVLAHISNLVTKQFAGSVDPIEADEWRSRLVRQL